MHGVTFFALASCLVFSVCTSAPLIVRIYEEGFDSVEVTSVSRESVGDYESQYEDRDYQRTLKYPKLVKEFDISEKYLLFAKSMDHLAVSCPHVIQKICSYLDVGDIISFAKTCKSVNKIVDDEKMWIMLNFRDYNVSEEAVWTSWSSKNFYQLVLYKFHRLFGLFKRNFNSFGGLLKTIVDQNCITLCEVLPPVDFCWLQNGNLLTYLEPDASILKSTIKAGQLAPHLGRLYPIFSLRPSGHLVICECFHCNDQEAVDENGHCPCSFTVQGTSGRSKYQLCWDSCFSWSNDGFKFTCHKSTSENQGVDFDVDLQDFLRREHGAVRKSSDVTSMKEFNHNYLYYRPESLRKCLAFLKNRGIYDAIRLPCFETPSNVENPFLIKPGIYFGTCSNRGWLIYEIRYDFSSTILTGVNLTFNLDVHHLKSVQKLNKVITNKILSNGKRTSTSERSEFLLPPDLITQVEHLLSSSTGQYLGKGFIGEMMQSEDLPTKDLESSVLSQKNLNYFVLHTTFDIYKTYTCFPIICARCYTFVFVSNDQFDVDDSNVLLNVSSLFISLLILNCYKISSITLHLRITYEYKIYGNVL
ncbi:hypothetical protein T12_1078 [Trichinella patagoniensis]|uniref:F-box domain-containing protein n=1 Tax=Trichinella patagoniensis TaxID=990121 RepID=A0A0V1A663_9BILA|nr:hypothetical protein T12_1078 [Trichinella patagoniensis]